MCLNSVQFHRMLQNQVADWSSEFRLLEAVEGVACFCSQFHVKVEYSA